MSTPPFVPRADLAFMHWAAQFASRLHESPYSYGVSPADGETAMQTVQTFVDAMALTGNDSTRTKVAIAAKDDARWAAEGLLRRYAAIIRANNGISDPDKIAIGVRPRNLSRTRRNVPATSPTLKFIASVPGGNVLHFGDSVNPGRAKPFGAERLELWVAFRPVGTKPSRSQLPPKEAQFIRAYRKNPINVEHDIEKLDAGFVPTYWGRWAGFHDDVGPWSLACYTRLGKEQKEKTKQQNNTPQSHSDDDDFQSLKKAA